MDNMLTKLAFSWSQKEGNINKTKDILEWIEGLNQTVKVNIHKTSLTTQGGDWYYDRTNGEITNKRKSFFSIKAIRSKDDRGNVFEQPIMIQDEIGYLGMICKEFDGVVNLLVQAKIEPGNINKVQLSPTIQATKSNFRDMEMFKECLLEVLVE